MNKHISSILLFTISCIVFAGCDESLPSDNDNEELRIELCIPPALEVETKASDNDKLDVTVSNVWVIQYDKDGVFKKIAYIDNPEAFAAPSKKTMVVTTSGFEKVESRFYVIANAGQSEVFPSTGFTGTESDLKSKTYPITAGATDAPTFLTAGPIPLTLDSINKYEGKASIVAPLERAFARVVVQWYNKTRESGDTYSKGNIEITKVEVCNLPKGMAAYSRGGNTGNIAYPELNNIHTNDTDIGGGTLAEGGERTFYMAENLRGTGYGTTFAEKNKSENGPGNNLDGCTYVRLTGTYAYLISTPVGGSTPTYSSPIDVEYKIYLGGNLTNDYNIQRGYSYNLVVNISGANSADLRVTITNGNVAVFDDVVVIPNITVNF